MPYKITIAGPYKKIRFCLLKTFQGKSIVLDGTCYMLGLKSLKEAKEYLAVLTSLLVQDYISFLIFNDAKRPITSDLSQTIDLPKVIRPSSRYRRTSSQDINLY